MAKPLRMLLVDDCGDGALLLRERSRGGFDADSHRVDTPEEFDRALDENRPDFAQGYAIQRPHQVQPAADG